MVTDNELHSNCEYDFIETKEKKMPFLFDMDELMLLEGEKKREIIGSN